MMITHSLNTCNRLYTRTPPCAASRHLPSSRRRAKEVVHAWRPRAPLCVILSGDRPRSDLRSPCGVPPSGFDHRSAVAQDDTGGRSRTRRAMRSNCGASGSTNTFSTACQRESYFYLVVQPFSVRTRSFATRYCGENIRQLQSPRSLHAPGRSYAISRRLAA